MTRIPKGLVWGWRSASLRWGFYRSDIRDVAGDLYMQRWILATPWGMLRLHHILQADGGRNTHDHPFDFVTMILRGGYTEEIVDGNRTAWVTRTAGSRVHHVAEAPHRICMLHGDTWTLVLAGAIRRTWGFHTPRGWVPFTEYAKPE